MPGTKRSSITGARLELRKLEPGPFNQNKNQWRYRGSAEINQRTFAFSHSLDPKRTFNTRLQRAQTASAALPSQLRCMPRLDCSSQIADRYAMEALKGIV
jgi:hypothetical protein